MSHEKTTTAASNVQRELDQRLLEMCNGQLRALGTVVNRLTMSVLIVGMVCAGLLLWTLQATHMRHDALIARIAALEANQAAESQDVIQATKATQAYAARASKHIWELKRALKLNFSQERSAAGAQDGEM